LKCYSIIIIHESDKSEWFLKDLKNDSNQVFKSGFINGGKMREKNLILVKRAILPLSVIIFSFLSLSCFGATIRVPQDYGNIQAAINAAVNNDEIIVSPGAYGKINFGGKNIIVRSTSPENPGVVEKTIIDGQDLYHCVTFAGTESELCVLSGFTITRGNAGSDDGGGILGNGALAKIQYNLIQLNQADHSGGGIYGCHGIIQYNIIANNTIDESYGYFGGGLSNCNGTIQYNTIMGNTANEYGGGLSHCDGTIQYNTITDNTAESGGGIAWCSGTIQNNTITGNRAYGEGGGLSACSNGVIQNNAITGNMADYHGGGLHDCNGTIWNNNIWMNTAMDGGGLCNCDNGNIHGNTIWNNRATNLGGGLNDCSSIIKNCVIWGNSAPVDGDQIYNSSTPDYSCIEDWTGGGTGNIASDPKLLLPEWGEFHLKADSPCIDAGGLISELDEDFEGDDRGYNGTLESRGDGSDYDIGADEYIGTVPVITPTPTPCAISVPGDYSTIQAAIDASQDGCKIIVSPGTYKENINFKGKNIILSSTDPGNPAIVAGTIIDGNQGGSVVTFSGKESAFCSIEGFTITNGKAREGGGIYAKYCLVTITNCVIKGNTASLYGGGISYNYGIIQNNTIYGNTAEYGGGILWCRGTIQKNMIKGNTASYGGGIVFCSFGTIQDNTITGNTAEYGGGLYNCESTIRNNKITDNTAYENGGGLWFCNATIQNNMITGNLAGNNGGGLSKCYKSSTQDNTITGNTISGNTADYGGGFYDCKGIIQDNTIWMNSAINGGGLYDCDNANILGNTIWNNRATNLGGGLYDCGSAIKNCIIWGNSSPNGGSQLHDSSLPDYSCIENWTVGGTGNVSLDPKLLLPEWGEFHLKADSPCIDAGGLISALTTDFEGDDRGYNGTLEPRGDGSDYDIGADEYIGVVPTITPTPTPCEITVPGDYSTIQAAIDASHDGCKIIVSPDTYIENINFKGKNIILSSTDPGNPAVVAGTIIDGNETGPVVTFSGRESAFCSIEGFTITNGKAEDGGGINANGCLVMIKNCVIKGNTSSSTGGGIYKCNGIIQDNTITGNTAWGGGGLYNCEGTIQSNTISGNTADFYGGGLSACSNGVIQNNRITGNMADNGGGLSDCNNGLILNNTIWMNSAIYGGGMNKSYTANIYGNTIWNNRAVRFGGGLYDCSSAIKNCIIWGNTAPTGNAQVYYSSFPSYSCIEDWSFGGTENISLDPKLLLPEWGEFHLNADSPCIDAGCLILDSTTDFEGDSRGYDGTAEPRGDGNNYDIGADEYIGTVPTVTPTPTPCKITVPGDYSTIQAAIDAAEDGCKIIVSPGTYNENINFKGKNIILSSTDPDNPAIVEGTIIDGKEAGSVVTFSGKESAFCVLEGFTITNGKAENGGGINGNDCLAMIRDCVIKGNTAISKGGGIYRANGIIQNNTIKDNTAIWGGGLHFCYGTIQDNTITGNSASGGGAGIYSCDGTIQNNTIAKNTADKDGGGISYCSYSTIQNNAITGNMADYGGGISWCNDSAIRNNTIWMNAALYGGGMNYCNNGTIQGNTIWNNRAVESGGGIYDCKSGIENCIIWGNDAPGHGAQVDNSTTFTYSCIEDWTLGGTGNISLDPKLLLPEWGEFHLKMDSPCIDAGCLISGSDEDFEGDIRGYDGTSESRGDGSDYDIGADEYIGIVPTVTPTPTPTPISRRQLIDYLLGRLTGIGRDLNGDSVIDAADLIWLIKNGG
jgi:hypothetical protein